MSCRPAQGLASLSIPLALFVLTAALQADMPSPPGDVQRQLKQACFDCHDKDTSEGGLNLTLVPWELERPENRQRWIKIHDRIAKGEMPPDGVGLTDADRATLLDALAAPIRQIDLAEIRRSGRGPLRRLTRGEFEQDLRDLLMLPHLDIRDMLPEDREGDHCNKVATALDFSRVQLEACLQATETALVAAAASGVAPRPAQHDFLPATRMFVAANTFGEREAMFYAKDSQMVPLSGGDLSRLRKDGTHDPEMELAIFRSASWPYYGYPDTFIAREPGDYHIRFSARAVLQQPGYRLEPAREPIPMTFRARKRSDADVSGDVRATGGVMDIEPEAGTYETTIRLKRNETFEYSLLGLPVPRAINPENGPLYYKFPPMPPEGHPGIAFQWLEISGPIDSEEWPPASHKVLFGELPIRASPGGQLRIELVSTNPEQDAIRLLDRFIARAERYPTSDAAREIYHELVLQELRSGVPLAEALISAYSAVLCSGEFLFLREPSGSTRAVALANRLSFFLSESRPDAQLSQHASEGTLLQPDVLRSETDRLIDAETFARFVSNFSDHWFSLKDIRRDEPDVRLYPEYRFDDYLIESLEAETKAYVLTMIRENLPVTSLVDSDFVLINDHLADHYGFEPISGSRLRRVQLPEESPYGGMLTQGAIMKVTANGTTTSPVIRGAWIAERLLGNPPPPPPPVVPASEPDLRGATSVREQLARHTTDISCSACHARFDPYGFALENFDIMGAWRDRYRSLAVGEKVTGIDRAGHDFEYYISVDVDASSKLLDGRSFNDIEGLKQLLMDNPRRIARSLLEQFVVYSTGTPIRFSDRTELESILDDCAATGYRTRDLIHGLVQSRMFTGTELP